MRANVNGALESKQRGRVLTFSFHRHHHNYTNLRMDRLYCDGIRPPEGEQRTQTRLRWAPWRRLEGPSEESSGTFRGFLEGGLFVWQSDKRQTRSFFSRLYVCAESAANQNENGSRSSPSFVCLLAVAPGRKQIRCFFVNSSAGGGGRAHIARRASHMPDEDSDDG